MKPDGEFDEDEDLDEDEDEDEDSDFDENLDPNTDRDLDQDKNRDRNLHLKRGRGRTRKSKKRVKTYPAIATFKFGHDWVTHNFNTGESYISESPISDALMGMTGSPQETYTILKRDFDPPSISFARIGGLLARLSGKQVTFHREQNRPDEFEYLAEPPIMQFGRRRSRGF